MTSKDLLEQSTYIFKVQGKKETVEVEHLYLMSAYQIACNQHPNRTVYCIGKKA